MQYTCLKLIQKILGCITQKYNNNMYGIRKLCLLLILTAASCHLESKSAFTINALLLLQEPLHDIWIVSQREFVYII